MYMPSDPNIAGLLFEHSQGAGARDERQLLSLSLFGRANTQIRS